MAFPTPVGPLTSAGYGGMPYGVAGWGASPTTHYSSNPMAGYGAAPYGHSSYGSLDFSLLAVSGSRSLNGTQVEIFLNNPATATDLLALPSSYTITTELGVPATVIAAEMPTSASILLTLSGTTLGGKYLIEVLPTVTTPTIEPDRSIVEVLTLSDNVTAAVSVESGNQVLVTFSEPMLPESAWSPGVAAVESYDVLTEYPAAPVLQTVTSPVEGDATKALLSIAGMTSVDYIATLGTSEAIEYDATVYPDATVIGVGTSALSGSSLLLSKTEDDFYGWGFADESGRLQIGSTFRANLDVDASVATISPPLLNGTLLVYTVSDGTWEAQILLSRVSGQDVVELLSGSFSAQTPAAWSVGPTQVSIIRNQRAELVSVLLDGVPIISAAMAELDGVASLAAGVQFVLSAGSSVHSFVVNGLSVSASNTLFTSTWNFVHGLQVPFVGSASLARAVLTTQRGPLVKSWGDMVPAEVSDVSVLVNGVEVVVSAVNPYTGEITLETPLPLAPPGTNAVSVSYAWWENATFPMASRDVSGLVYDQWTTFNNERNPDATSTGVGAARSTRFQYSLLTMPDPRLQPYRRSPRFRVVEPSYSAVMDSPDSLLYGQDPFALVKGQLTQAPEPSLVSFEGDRAPASQGWVANGVDTGGSDGFDYTIKVGSDDVGASYYTTVDLTWPSAVSVVGQVQAVNWTADGVFTGVGVGFHDNARLFLAGLLVVSGVKHVGLLVDSARPDLEASWKVGPAVSITVSGLYTFQTDWSGFTPGSRFRIASGPQAGVYTVATCGVVAAGTGEWMVSVTTAFPAAPSTFGAKTASALLEVDWSQDPVNLRLIANVPARSATLIVGSASVTLSEVVARPADTALLLPVVETGGALFWGVTARNAAGSESTWSFIRGVVQPDSTTTSYTGSTTTLDTGVAPDSQGWFASGTFGVVTSGYDFEHTSTFGPLGYSKFEPFLSLRTRETIDCSFAVETFSASGATQLQVEDGVRSAVMSTLAYRVNGGRHELVSLPTVSISCTDLPENDGWSVSINTASITTLIDELGRGLRVETAAGETAAWVIALAVGDGGTEDTVADVVFSTDATDLAPGQGPILSIPASGRTVQLGLASSPSRVVLISGGTEVDGFNFAWDDGETHRYRLITNQNSDTVSVLADGILLGTTPLSSFSTTGSRTVGFGVVGGVSSTTIWRAVSAHPLPSADVHTTVGVRSPYWSKDPTNIDGWVIPRSDSTGAKNSSALAEIVDVDWTTSTSLRLTLDPSFGSKLYLDPDYVNPVLAVEYSRLPRSVYSIGSVALGSLSGGLSRASWAALEYTVALRDGSEFLAPQNMVRDRANMLTSGELRQDTSPETITVPVVVGSTIFGLQEANINLSRIFTVTVGAITWASDQIAFDVATQTVTLPTAATGTVAVVVGVPGSPVTSTYLCAQPLEQGTTVLNEDTPAWSQTKIAEGDLLPIDDCDVEEGVRGLVAPAIDNGVVGLALEGSFTSEAVRIPTDRTAGVTALVVQGGRRLVGGEAKFNSRHAVGSHTSATVSVRMALAMTAGEEVVDVSGWDDTDPDGVSAPNGACVAVIEEDGAASRIGPWAGVAASTPRSLVSTFTFSGGSRLPAGTRLRINVQSA